MSLKNYLVSMRKTEVYWLKNNTVAGVTIRIKAVALAAIFSAVTRNKLGINSAVPFLPTLPYVWIPTMQLLTRIMAWAERQYKFFEVKKTGQKSYKEVRNNLLIPQGDTSKCLMSWIGFQNLSAKELTQVCTMYPELLTDEEFKMFVIYACVEGEKPSLPKWA